MQSALEVDPTLRNLYMKNHGAFLIHVCFLSRDRKIEVNKKEKNEGEGEEKEREESGCPADT